MDIGLVQLRIFSVSSSNLLRKLSELHPRNVGEGPSESYIKRVQCSIYSKQHHYGRRKFIKISLPFRLDWTGGFRCWVIEKDGLLNNK